MIVNKLILLFGVLVIVVLFANKYIENEKIRESEKAERIILETRIKNELKEFVENNAAISDWEKVLLKGKKFRVEPILTIELEKAWLHSKPILFIGSIKDISSKNNEYYTVIFEQNNYINSKFLFLSTELELSIECLKSKVDSLLVKHPSLIGERKFDNGVAVIASMNNLQTSEKLINYDDKIDVKTGVGSCVDMLFVDDVNY